MCVKKAAEDILGNFVACPGRVDMLESVGILLNELAQTIVYKHNQLQIHQSSINL